MMRLYRVGLIAGFMLAIVKIISAIEPTEIKPKIGAELYHKFGRK